MKIFMFAVRDSASSTFGNPMFVPSAGAAIRGFSDEVNRQADDNLLFRHSSDFELYSLGEYETDTGLFVTTPPVMLVRGVDVRVK